MGLSSDITEKDWMTEAQRSMIITNEAIKNNLYHDTVGAGVSSTQINQSPHNFAWPVPEVTRHVTDYKNVHTEYRDNYHELESNKVFILLLFIIITTITILFQILYLICRQSLHDHLYQIL